MVRLIICLPLQLTKLKIFTLIILQAFDFARAFLSWLGICIFSNLGFLLLR